MHNAKTRCLFVADTFADNGLPTGGGPGRSHRLRPLQTHDPRREVGAILGGFEEERDFSSLILDAWLNATETGRAQAFESIRRRLDEARTQHEGAKTLDEALFAQDFEAA